MTTNFPFRGRIIEPGLIEIKGIEAGAKFIRMCAGLSAPAVDPGYFCVVGEIEAGGYHCLYEREDRTEGIAQALRIAVDELCVEYVWLDGITRPAALRIIDKFSEKDGPGLRRPITQFKSLPIFGSPRAALGDDFPAALDVIRDIIIGGSLMIHTSYCPRLMYTLKQPWADILDSAVIRALVWVISGMEADRGAYEPPAADAWYANRRKV